MENKITYEKITEVNKAMKTTTLKNEKTGKVIGDYVEVNQRIKAFRMMCPAGVIKTEMLANENGTCIFKASIYDEEDNLLATGTAYEKENSTFINKTSYIENCETSAVGRALGMLGLGIDTSIASAEEVQNAIENQTDYRQELINYCNKNKLDMTSVAKDYGLNKNSNQKDYKEVLERLMIWQPLEGGKDENNK